MTCNTMAIRGSKPLPTLIRTEAYAFALAVVRQGQLPEWATEDVEGLLEERPQWEAMVGRLI